MEENQTPTSPIAGEPASLKPGMVVPRGALMALRATMHSALADYADVEDGWAAAAGDLSHALYNACDQLDALLGFTNPDAGEGLTHEDGDFIMAQDESEQMPADYWHGEMKAEIEAERRADAAYELAAELASCDWEGWN